ncbi:GNAT family N-acetyltransferase [Cohnella suwonensis]
MGPRFVYPLTPDQIVAMLENRHSPTVVLGEADTPVAYANLYDVDAERSSCWLGNVIVSNAYRGHGAARYLLRTMMTLAREKYRLDKMKLYCHNTNTKALLFYCNNGFVPCGSRIIENHRKETIVSIEMERTLHLGD